jgi:putative heme iron utilization protein
MSISNDYLDYVTEQLSKFGEITIRIETSENAFEIMEELDDIWKKYYYKN